MLEVEKHSVASRTHQWGTRGCPAAGESERTAGELLITGAIHRLSCSVSNQGGSWGFRGIKYGLRVNRRRRGLVALTGKKCTGQLRADGEGGCVRRFSRGSRLLGPEDNRPKYAVKVSHTEKS